MKIHGENKRQMITRMSQKGVQIFFQIVGPLEIDWSSSFTFFCTNFQLFISFLSFLSQTQELTFSLKFHNERYWLSFFLTSPVPLDTGSVESDE